jgi:hypothetical protein
VDYERNNGDCRSSLQRIFQRKCPQTITGHERFVLLIIVLLPSCLFLGLLGELLIDGE